MTRIDAAAALERADSGASAKSDDDNDDDDDDCDCGKAERIGAAS